MGLPSLVAAVYRALAPHRRLLLALTAVALAASTAGLGKLTLAENAQALLPDGASEAAEGFRLLQEAPFARKVVITLTADPGVPLGEATAAADRVVAALGPPWFRGAAAGPGDKAGPGLVTWFLAALPSLATAEDLAAVAARLTPGEFAERLAGAREALLSPEGMVLKGVIREDPLELRQLALAKLRHVSLGPGLRLHGTHFASADGRSALVIADTPVAVTDSGGAREVVARVETALAGAVPPGVTATWVSGHRYALANAETIRGDLAVVLGASALGLLALFAAFLRSWRALYVFAIPVAVVSVAAGAVALVYGQVSAITLGFGAVLLGITVDFGIHVYVALGRGEGPVDRVMGQVARPILFGGLTTLGAFGVLLLSDLPGQRQLAVFSLAGIAAALALALLVLPHLLAGHRAPGREGAPPPPAPLRGGRRVLAGWAAALAVCGWFGAGVRFDGDVKALGVVPPEVAAAEETVRQTWGDLRGRALAAVDGPDLGAALEANEALFAHLDAHLAPGDLVSLAPLVPSPATQEANRARWAAFWEGRRDGLAGALGTVGATLGFTEVAFAPFLARLDAAPPPVTPEALEALGLGEAVGALVTRGEGYARVLTLVPDGPEVAALASPAAGAPPGVRWAFPSRFRAEVSAAIGADFRQFVVGAGLVNLVLLAALFRRPRRVAAALVPVLSGLAALAGGMGALGWTFNLFNVVAAILIIGLGVDYGIFMVCRTTEAYDHDTGRAVLLSGLTTLAGFGALALARHPALHSMGVTVLLGLGAAIPAALWVTPRVCGASR